MSRQFDLPPMWDGLVVQWRGWEPQLRAFICPPPKDPACCRKCGSLTAPVCNVGYVATSPAVTHADVEYEEANRRRLGSLAHKRKPLVWMRLFVWRCPDCRHDVVHDNDTDECWDLDDTDYGPDGSHDENTMQGALF